MSTRFALSYMKRLHIVEPLLKDIPYTGLNTLIYYIKAKSRLPICLSVGTFSGTHFALWFQRGSTPDILDMKRPSLQIMISALKRF